MTLDSRLLCTFSIEVGEAVTPADGAYGRRFIPILGGEVTGGLTGRILPGGGDWQTVCPNGALEINAHYNIEIEGHGVVEIRSDGVRYAPENAPDKPYFRTTIRFRTSAPGLDRLNHVLAITTGRREADRVILDLHELI